jgi:DNA-binding CsgD family transcriptional regulator
MATGVEPPLVGRDVQWSSIGAFLSRAAEAPTALCLVGGPGLGKSVLLDAAAVVAAGRGVVVLRAAGVEPESGIAFATLHQLLTPVRPGFAELPGDARQVLSWALGSSTAGDGDVAAATAVLLRRCAADRPVLMVVDDWQWVDDSSAAVLTSARHLAEAPVGLLVATRADIATQSFLDAVERIEVLPLGEEDAEKLLRERFPALAARVGRRVLAAAQGNPLALLELAGALSEEQRSGRQPLPALPSAVGRLHDHYMRHVAGLPEYTRRRLLLNALGDTSGQETTTGDDAWLRNPWARSAVVRSSTGEERVAAHRELAQLAIDEPALRAGHLAEATVGPDETVAASLQDAAHGALRAGDALGAVTALLRAAELSADGLHRSRRLAEAAYVGANVAGNLRTMPALLAEARLAAPDGRGSLPIAVAAAHLIFNGDGHLETAHRLLTAIIDAAIARLGDDDPMPVEALYQLADVCFYAARDDLWGELEDALRRLGPRVPALLLIYAQTLRDPTSLTASDRLRLDTALRGTETEHDPTVVFRIGRIAIACNRLGEWLQPLSRLVDDGRAGGAVGSAINAMMLLSSDALTTGRSDEADLIADEALQLCEAHGYGLMAAPFQLIRMLVAARRGQADLVREPAIRVAAWAVPRGVRPIAQYCYWAQATLAVANGEFEEAYHHCVAITVPGQLPPQTPVPFRSSLELIESALRTGRRTEAVAHARAVATSGFQMVSPSFGLTVLAAEALVTDDDEQAAALFSQALAVPGAEELRWDNARVRLFFGERLRRSRAGTHARAELEAAAAAFERMGAAPWSARARRELQASATSRSRPHLPGTAVLTPREAQVVTLAAAGLSNKQIGEKLFLSPRTVGAHLSSAFGKLGIRSRVALGAVLGDPEVRA